MVESLTRRLACLVVALGAFATAAAAQTTFDGLVYAHYRYGLTNDSSLTPPSAPNNFDVNRVHLTWRSQADNGVSTRLTLDMDGRSAQSNQLSMRVKFAQVSWKPSGSSLTWKFGQQPVPIVGFIEDMYGYRMQGPVAIDRYRYQAAGDFGFAVEGAYRDQGVSFDAGIFNGENFFGAPGDHRKDVAARVSVRLKPTDDSSKTGGLRLTGYASVGAPTDGGSRNRVLLLLSYATKKYTLAGELAATMDSTAGDPRTPGAFLSLWGTYQKPGSPWGIMARVDQLDPNTDLSPSVASLASSEQTRLITGVSYTLSKALRVLVDIDWASLEGSGVPNAFEAANRTLFFHTEIKF